MHRKLFFGIVSTRKAQRMESSASIATQGWGPFSRNQQGSTISHVVRSHLFLSSSSSRDSELLETPLTLGKNTLRLLGQYRHCQNTGYNTRLDQCRGNQPGKDRDAISIDTGRVANISKSATSLERITRSRAGFLLPAKPWSVEGTPFVSIVSFT